MLRSSSFDDMNCSGDTDIQTNVLFCHIKFMCLVSPGAYKTSWSTGVGSRGRSQARQLQSMSDFALHVPWCLPNTANTWFSWASDPPKVILQLSILADQYKQSSTGDSLGAICWCTVTMHIYHMTCLWDRTSMAFCFSISPRESWTPASSISTHCQV